MAVEDDLAQAQMNVGHALAAAHVQSQLALGHQKALAAARVNRDPGGGPVTPGAAPPAHQALASALAAHQADQLQLSRQLGIAPITNPGG